MPKNRRDRHNDPPERIKLEGGQTWSRFLCEVLDEDEDTGHPTLLAIIQSTHELEAPVDKSRFYYVYLEERPGE